MIELSFAILIDDILSSLVGVHSGRFGAGAGVVWRRGGMIVTNDHVVRKRHLRISLASGEQVPANLVGRDKTLDLALLKVDHLKLPPVDIARSGSVRVGEFVFAIGHPWGQRNAVSMGIVSRMSRTSGQGKREAIPLIYSDVYLAPGNSGGPLVNASGEVVGLNTMLIGGDQGVAIPSNVVEDFVARNLGEDAGLLL